MGGCPVPDGAHDYTHGSKWHIMLWIAGVSTAVTMGISLSLCILHLRRYRAPKEQRQILRILFSVVVYSLVAFFEIYKYKIAQYIDPIGDAYEAFGLCALYLLFIQYAAPTNKFNEVTLDNALRASEHKVGFDWVHVSWIFVFQYPIFEVLCVAIQEVTQVKNVYCLSSLDPKYAHLWVELINSVSIGACVMAIVRFYGRTKKMMKLRRGLSKIVAFKAIVGIRFLQGWIFSTLLQHNIIKTSSSFSYNDILYGIPAVLICVEMVFFSLGFWYAYSSSEYSSSAHSREAPLPLMRAVVHALNPSDLIMGMARIPSYAVALHHSGDWAAWRKAAGSRGLIGIVNKGAQKYQSKRSGGNSSGPSGADSPDINPSTPALARPTSSYHGPSDSNSSQHHHSNEYPLSTNLHSQREDMYRPTPMPDCPPEYYEQNYLMAESNPATNYQRYADGRARSPSGSYLMVGEPTQGVERPSVEWNGQRYNRTPSPDGRFDDAGAHGRSMV